MNWNNMWNILFNRTELFGINMGFWVCLLVITIIVILMNVVFWSMKPLNAIEKLDPSFEEFNKRVLVNQPFRWNKRMYLMPIDYNEIIKNPQLVQAPGY